MLFWKHYLKVLSAKHSCCSKKDVCWTTVNLWKIVGPTSPNPSFSWCFCFLDLDFLVCWLCFCCVCFVFCLFCCWSVLGAVPSVRGGGSCLFCLCALECVFLVVLFLVCFCFVHCASWRGSRFCSCFVLCWFVLFVLVVCLFVFVFVFVLSVSYDAHCLPCNSSVLLV